jgi:hypothetical protein
MFTVARAATRGAAAPLWCPGATACHTERLRATCQAQGGARPRGAQPSGCAADTDSQIACGCDRQTNSLIENSEWMRATRDGEARGCRADTDGMAGSESGMDLATRIPPCTHGGIRVCDATRVCDARRHDAGTCCDAAPEARLQ